MLIFTVRDITEFSFTGGPEGNSDLAKNYKFFLPLFYKPDSFCFAYRNEYSFQTRIVPDFSFAATK